MFKISSTHIPIFLFLMCIFFSCHSRKENASVIDSKTLDADVHRTSEVDPNDTLSILSTYFDKKGSIIPVDFCARCLRIKNPKPLYSNCYSDILLHHESLSLFVIMLQCTAGGTCEEKRLLVFQNGRIVSSLVVALDIADADFSKSIQYNLIGRDTIGLRFKYQELEDDNPIRDSAYVEYYHIEKDGTIRKIE